MPIQYEGVLAEHTWCRTSAALFDVSHMATVDLRGDDPATALERLSPAGITTLAEGRQRYGLLLNDGGGTIDDFMVTNHGASDGGRLLTMVVNASRRQVDLEVLRAGLPDVDVIERTDVALLAVQGPEAAAVVTALDPTLADTVFLDSRAAVLDGIPVQATRAGYTGEDGFELAVDGDRAEALARVLLADERVRPAGLGARDTLRLEAGLCLYGNDLDETVSPVEADLVWTMPKRRRTAGDFIGAERVLRELHDGPSRVRVGLAPAGRRPIRPGAALRPAGTATDADVVGVVSSGGFGPSVEAPVAMGFVPPALSQPGTELTADVRGKDQSCTVSPLPFSPHRYLRS
jgi:aminomethyltransferase